MMNKHPKNSESLNGNVRESFVTWCEFLSGPGLFDDCVTLDPTEVQKAWDALNQDTTLMQMSVFPIISHFALSKTYNEFNQIGNIDSIKISEPKFKELCGNIDETNDIKTSHDNLKFENMLTEYEKLFPGFIKRCSENILLMSEEYQKVKFGFNEKQAYLTLTLKFSFVLCVPVFIAFLIFSGSADFWSALILILILWITIFQTSWVTKFANFFAVKVWKLN